MPIIFLTGSPATFQLVGVFRFGDSDSTRGCHPSPASRPRPRSGSSSRDGEWDAIDVAGERRASRSEELVRQRPGRAAWPPADGSADYEVLTGKELADEQASDVKDRLGSSTPSCSCSRSSRCSSARSSSTTRSRSSSPNGRASWRCCARSARAGKQVTRSVAVEAFVVGLLSSVLGLGLGVLVAIGLQSAARGVRVRAAERGAGDPRPARSSSRWWPAPSSRSCRHSRPRAGAAKRAHRWPRCVTARSSRRAAPAGSPSVGGLLAVIGIILARARPLRRRELRIDVPGGARRRGRRRRVPRVHRRGHAQPAVARPGVSQFLGWLPARLRGMSGVLARENAMRNPRRTATTASALMIGLALVTLVVDHRRVGEEVVRNDHRRHACAPTSSCTARASSPGLHARRSPTQSATSCRTRRSCEFRQGNFGSSTATSEQLLGVSTERRGRDRLELQPAADLDAFADGGVLRVQGRPRTTRAGRSATTIDDAVREDRVQQVTIQGIYDENQSIGSRLSAVARARTRTNYTDQADSLVGVREGEGDVVGGRTRRVISRTVLRAVSRRSRSQDQTEFKDSQIAQFNTILNLLYVMLLLAVVIALIGIVNTLALSIYERTPRARLAARGRDDPHAGEHDGARRSGDHLDLRVAARARDRARRSAAALVELRSATTASSFSLPVVAARDLRDPRRARGGVPRRRAAAGTTCEASPRGVTPVLYQSVPWTRRASHALRPHGGPQHETHGASPSARAPARQAGSRPLPE